ncbi:clostripain-related cysteine peptidase [uncultured Treponema sp.]|uniref:clostripain-related cysteine peptidase n=1 Tax=uncultured Treponema sp. TaxID=162155 RepID=UPI002600B8FF|nr:clostripain-related cysteine peptidase [uncultured Treponema sp.]
MKILRLLLLFPLALLLFACGTDFSTQDSLVKPDSRPEKTDTETVETLVSVKEDEKDYIVDDADFTDYEVFEEEIEEEPPPPPPPPPVIEIHREWTILVYMAADNNLESDAITDFNEMENADFDESVTVLALLDRAEKYDATNDDWTDTRLYRICRDEQQNKTLIVSEELDCDELCLKSGSQTELDMANPSTLSAFCEFARKTYPADNYALILWGHGSGWREAASETELVCGEDSFENRNFRAVAFDNASDSYMTISQLGKAVFEGMDGEKLALIGFDTCFGMCLESAYELTDCACYMAGTPALVPESGWNYTEFLTRFAAGEKSCESMIDSIFAQYEKSYGNYAYASFSCVDLSKIPSFVTQFSDYSFQLASSINDKAERDRIMKIFTEKAVSYCSASFPTDFYVDVKSCLSLLAPSSKGTDSLILALDDAVFRSWSASGKTCSLGLFFCVYRNSSVIQSSHPAMYVNGAREPLLSRFVRDCTGYVPLRDENVSLLNRLFYTNFN